MNKLTSINFPCVMLESNDKQHYTIESMNKFAICRSNLEIKERAEYFKNPALCYYYTIINEALRQEKILLTK